MTVMLPSESNSAMELNRLLGDRAVAVSCQQSGLAGKVGLAFAALRICYARSRGKRPSRRCTCARGSVQENLHSYGASAGPRLMRAAMASRGVLPVAETTTIDEQGD